jgi:ribosomal protein S12 methylthiotransferase accessory factor
LEDAFKRYTHDQDKVLTPEETVQRFKETLKTVRLDIMKETLRIDTGRLGIPVYISTCGEDAAAVTGTKKQMGKGATVEQAKASAVMELAERFSFFSFARNPDNFVVDTFANLGDRAVSFETIARSVHDPAGERAAGRRAFESLPLKWTRGFNLTRGEECLIPFDWFFAINEFNGPSAGNCREEAILQGICEIVERHVCSIISHERRDAPRLATEAATDPMVIEMLEKYRACGVQLTVSDFTLEMGIPSVGVLAHDPSTFPGLSEIVWTAGTTPNPEKALSRALTEVAQLAGDFNTSANYVASGLPKFTRLAEADYITRPSRTVALKDLPDLSHDNIRVEIENCLQALSTRGFEVLVVDTTHPQLRIPAFYTIIPGAHFRERSRGTSVGMFTAKLIVQKMEPREADRALAALEEELPRSYFVQFYRGLCRLNNGDPEGGLAYFRGALALEPDAEETPSIYSYTGVALKELGRYAEALEALAEGARLDDERTDLFNLMGFCHYKLGAHDKAVAAFQRVIDLDPSSAIDYANLGVNYQALGEPEKAAHCYRMALKLDPGIDFARENLVGLKP